jgi:hypothetical protein
MITSSRGPRRVAGDGLCGWRVTGGGWRALRVQRLGSRDGFSIEHAPWPAGYQTPFMLSVSVSDDYFRTLDIPLRAGRTFDARDHADAPPVVVISEAMARRYWSQGDGVGSRIRTGPDPDALWMQVIGVVGEVRNDLTEAEPDP